MSGTAATSRRDALVVGACLVAATVQAVPSVLVAWAGSGPGAAADVALVAVSSPALLGVVAFGVVLAAALRQPALEPRSDRLRGPVDDRQAHSPPHVEMGSGPASAPVRCGPPPSTLRDRVRWAGLATLLGTAVTAGAVVLDGGATAGAASLLDSLDDGSAARTFVLLAFQEAFIDLRGPVLVGVAWVVLARAQRPVRPRPSRRGRRPRRWSAARTTRWSRAPRAG